MSKRSTSKRYSPTGIISLFVVLGGAGSLLAGGGCDKGDEKHQAKEPKVPVRVEPAREKDLVDDVHLSGEIQADVEVRVFSLVPERILELKFEEGDRVKKDQVLAVVKGGALWQAVRQAKAGLAAARTQAKLAKIELERTRKLFRSNTVAIAALQRAQAQYSVAKAQVAQMQASVGQTVTNIANVTIRAPIDGVVGQRFLSKGDLAGPQLPLCTIIQTDSVRVKAMATEFDLVKLKKRQPVTVTVPAFKKRKWTGNVDYIAPVIDRRTRSAWVTVLVKNPGGVLRPGMFADMRVQTAVRPDVVMTLARAVQRRVDARNRVRYHVFVLEGDRAKLRPVKIGARKEGLIEITKGLEKGEPVVVLGANRLRDGSRVKVREMPAVALRDDAEGGVIDAVSSGGRAVRVRPSARRRSRSAARGAARRAAGRRSAADSARPRARRRAAPPSARR
jgi:RND family efflux transporter MFP subunit